MQQFKILITIVFAALTHLTANAAEPKNYFYVNSYENTAAWGTGLTKVYDYTQVQAAIVAAAQWSATNGDAEAYVLLAVGSYRYNTASGSLSLKDGVTVIGGFAGTETDTVPAYMQSDYDPTDNTYVTSIRANQEIPVFVNTGIGPAAGLQNVVVEAGNGYNIGGGGGGMDNTNSSPTITNCTFMNNITNGNGGSMRNDNSNPTITNCTFTFTNNQIQATNGGGMYNTNGSSPTLTGCTFTNNSAVNNGGGMCNDSGSSPTLISCTFTGNKASSGGGVCVNSGSSMLINCTFTSNKAGSFGGGVNVATGGNATLVGCAATGNTSDIGAGVNIYSGTLINCTVMGNTADSSGSGVCTYNNPSTLINCLVALNNKSNALDDNVTGGAIIKSSVAGSTAYNSVGTTIPITPSAPAVTDFHSDGSLTSDAIYAIKQGDADLYKTALDTYNVLATLNAALGASLTAEDMLDINGLPVIDTNGRIDIGAFRYPGTVSGVTVNPSSIMLRKGQTSTFTATVDAQNGAGQRVAWSVNSTAGSTIDGNGVLTIAVGETANDLTVTATSLEDRTQSGTATVKVLDIPPAVTTVTANAGYGGTVSNGGSGLTYTVTPNSGFVIDQVFVDGMEQTISNRNTFSYTFNDDGGAHSIFATFRNNTSIADVKSPAERALKAWTGKNGQLHVSGLTVGKLWSVYDISGLLIHQSRATDEQSEINLAVKGVYIVVSGAERVKVVN